MRVPGIALATLLACTTAFPQAAKSTQPQSTAATNPTVAYVYVGVPQTTSGQVYAFSVQQDGTSAKISGSPFSGIAANLAVNSAHLYATDGTNIATFARSANGALHLTSTINGTSHNDTPQGSGVGALTLDRSAATLYAGELEFQGADNNAYAAFRTTSTGLNFAGNSNISVDDGGALEFSGNNQYAYGSGCYFADWDIFGYVRGSNGLLTLFNPGGTYPLGPDPSATYCPISLSASGHGFVAISYSSLDKSPDSIISVYQVFANGTLEQIAKSITDTGFISFLVLRFDPTGNYLAVAAKNGLVLYRLNADKTLTKMGKTIATNLTLNDLRWDSAGHLYGVTKTALYIFTMKSGQLTWSGSAAQQIAKPGFLSLAVLPAK